MPLTVIITPVIIGGWSVISSLAAVAAAGLGYKLLKRSVKETPEQTVHEIELTDENSKIIEESLKPEEELVFTKGDITLILKKDTREKFTICARSKTRSDKELTKIGSLFLDKIKQQYAYQKVKEEMTRRGFNIVQETTEQKKIRIVLRRF